MLWLPFEFFKNFFIQNQSAAGNVIQLKTLMRENCKHWKTVLKLVLNANMRVWQTHVLWNVKEHANLESCLYITFISSVSSIERIVPSLLTAALWSSSLVTVVRWSSFLVTVALWFSFLVTVARWFSFLVTVALWFSFLVTVARWSSFLVTVALWFSFLVTVLRGGNRGTSLAFKTSVNVQSYVKIDVFDILLNNGKFVQGEEELSVPNLLNDELSYFRKTLSSLGTGKMVNIGQAMVTPYFITQQNKIQAMHGVQ